MAKRRGRNTWVGMVAKVDKLTPAIVEQIVQSPQQAVFDGHLKRLLRGAAPVAGNSAAPEARDAPT